MQKWENNFHPARKRLVEQCYVILHKWWRLKKKNFTSRRTVNLIFVTPGYVALRSTQSRAQSSPAPRSAVGSPGRTLGTNFYRRNRAVPVLVRMLGFDVTEVNASVNGSHHEVNLTYFRYYMIEKYGISVKRAWAVFGIGAGWVFRFLLGNWEMSGAFW